ncbi:guanylate cyclase [Treponema sp. OMZ 787]|uniref:adenylate/guanylate cyclase domain-containing protein n=1 Tax=Treponema sp. OMZ 787 TaxID=2563669 RepID=UPI0020A27949|nr:adenylate/guanylate cyclase domain-containing protein [Treponema sp. OMZ 787]UTC61528.1 guanylate cyclase [Treponema sp. OMZ 787]
MVKCIRRVIVQKKVLFTITAIFMMLSVAAEISFNNLASSVQTFWADEKSGLPSNRIMDILQDSTGYIWLASYDGLMRFDGNNYTEFTEEEHGFTGLAPRFLYEDAEGTIWIGTNSTGLYSYKNKQFKKYGLESGLSNLSVRTIRFDKNNVMWVGTAGGLFRRKADGQFEHLDEGGKNIGIVFFIMPVDDKIFVGSNIEGLTVIQNGKIISLPYLQEIKDYTFSTAYVDTDGTLWFGTLSGKIIKIKNNSIKEIIDIKTLDGIGINRFLRTRDGNMYIATNKGIITLNGKEAEFFSEENGLPNNIVSCLCSDFEENLWAGMERGGLSKFSKGRFIDLASAESLPPTASNSVLEDMDKNIWIAKDDGAVCLKSSSLSKKRSDDIDNLLKMTEGNRIRQIREEADGSLYFSTYSDKGLLIFFKDGSIKSISKKDGLSGNSVRFTLRDSNGLLWIGTTSGPAVYHNGVITNFTKKDGLTNLFILCALESRNGSIWLGTDGSGAAELKVSLSEDRPKIKVERLLTREEGLIGNIVFRIVEDKDRNIWFSTSEGLSLYKDGIFYDANIAIGQKIISVYNVLYDTQGNLWIVAPKELILVKSDKFLQAVLNRHPAEGLVRYNRLDGLTGQLSANAWAHVTDKNTVYIPTLKGVAVCDPSYYVTNKHSPPVVIENVILDGNDFDLKENNFIIKPQVKRILFKFTALSYTVPERVRFEYKLEGYDNEWKSSGTTREIAYTNLSPGKYVFRVRAANNDGIINENGTGIEFYKEPFFYQTIWFDIFLILFIGGLIFSGVRIRFRALNKRAKELDRKVKEKTKELAEEKEKSDKLLRNTLPLPIIDELIETGTSKPKVYSAVSVLFADLVNFTKWSSANSPETVISELNNIFTHFDRIMDKFGCERIKTLGDGYMACCGFRGEEDHAFRLADAAIEMLSVIEDINKKNKSHFQVKIGIDSGKITGGIVGVHKYVFDIFGDVVNTTFRLEAATAPMACTVSEKTAAIIGDRYPLFKRPARELKGKGSVTTYYVRYKNTGNIKTFAELKELYEKLIQAFKEKDFDGCRKTLNLFDKTVLEPEMANNIRQIERVLSMN